MLEALKSLFESTALSEEVKQKYKKLGKRRSTRIVNKLQLNFVKNSLKNTSMINQLWLKQSMQCCLKS